MVLSGWETWVNCFDEILTKSLPPDVQKLSWPAESKSQELKELQSFWIFYQAEVLSRKRFFRQLLCNCMIKCILMKLKIKSDAVKNQVNILRIFFSFIINSLSMFQWQLITYLSTEPARRLLDNFHENSFKTQTEFLLKWTDR